MASLMRIDYIPIFEQLLTTERASWDDQAMLFAVSAATRSSCPRARTGAAFILDRRVVATGWNSPPRGLPNCSHPVNKPCSEAVHAEEAAIVWAAREGIRLEGTTCYSVTSPCAVCARMLIQVGVNRVIYLKEYRDLRGVELLQSVGILVEKMEL